MISKYFSFNFDQVCGRVYGLIRICISDSLAFNVSVHDKLKITFCAPVLLNFLNLLRKSDKILATASYFIFFPQLLQ